MRSTPPSSLSGASSAIVGGADRPRHRLRAHRAPQLLHASARLRGDGEIEIALPDGTVAHDDDALSAWLGRTVAPRSSEEVQGRRYENLSDIETEADDSWRTFIGSEQAFHDTYAVTLLSADMIGDWPMRRFRPNVVVDHAEDGLVGRSVQIGGAGRGDEPRHALRHGDPLAAGRDRDRS